MEEFLTGHTFSATVMQQLEKETEGNKMETDEVM